ncbi:MAG: ketoacyl-ACP synthase III [Oscillospiraceae bacterium]|nr:ketoacyl-ACP synthase III [Oscillospiraceae bacterium]
MSFRFLGTGAYVPETIVTNDALSKLVDTDDEWITQRVGVKRRHISKNQTAADMATEAAKRALENAGVLPAELDLILVATVSSETAAPSAACLVQRNIGAACMAFDISAACAGFLFALETANAYFMTRKIKKALVIGAERLSRLVNWSDRSTCVIFGDGAGAAVLGEGNAYLDSTFTVTGDDTVLRIPNYAGKSPYWEGKSEDPFIEMQGQATFKFAVQSMVRDIKLLLERNHLSTEDIACIVPHQANSRIIELAARKLGIPYERFVLNITEYGNTSAASVPIALDEAARKGILQKGDKFIMAGFGGGLASAANLMIWE